MTQKTFTCHTRKLGRSSIDSLAVRNDTWI